MNLLLKTFSKYDQTMKIKYFTFEFIIAFLFNTIFCFAANIVIQNNEVKKEVIFGNSKIMLTLDYNAKCKISQLEINSQNLISGSSGMFSEIRTLKNSFSTINLLSAPKVTVANNNVIVKGIRYGDIENKIIENWEFIITEKIVVLNIEREIENDILAEEVSFPVINFNDIKTWNAAFLGNGGVAWFYLFNEKLCTYGVHTDLSVFWNRDNNTVLKINSTSEGKQTAVKFSRNNDDKLVYSISVSDDELKPRYDADTKRRRFIRQKTDVWEPFILKAGKYKQTITLEPSNYSDEYNRGNFSGIDGEKITSLLNTVARIGVIDSKHFGANSWHTPYGPICLHEQYIGQLGIAINDPNYINGYKECLDFYRDNAVKPDGRVFSRWAYDNSDMMPGEVTPLGFYEAQWGYLFDSNTDLTTNVCELYNLCGDIDWVKTHKNSCEKTLEYLLKRDSNNNNLVEMMSDFYYEKKSSDWIDIMWASFENAFVNAKLYRALTLWSSVERQLGDNERALYYADYAEKLKKSFNKSIDDGGFWDSKNKWYVHWRDKDNSIHGNNLVTPVNFMAIAYGICEYNSRRNAILNKIELQMKTENLFFWPICMYPYQSDEGLDYQFPFPNYENGDLFLSWGGVGVESYASVNPELALNYVENILKQYDKDGLAFQRYSRISQQGAGDDILAGNALALVGLYKSIFGINPLYNRLYLNPNLPEKLSGTELIYNYRNDKLKIGLSTNSYSISNNQFKITSEKDFGFFSTSKELFYFNSNSDDYLIMAKPDAETNLSLDILKCGSNEINWNQVLTENHKSVYYTINNLEKNSNYTITINDKEILKLNSKNVGIIKFNYKFTCKVSNIKITGKFRNDLKVNSNTSVKNIFNAEYSSEYSKYDAGGKDGLFDGLRGSVNFNDGAWQGFEGEDMDVTFELKNQLGIKKVSAGFLENTSDWIYLPVLFEVYSSLDGIEFRKIGELNREEIKEFPEDEIKYISLSFKNVEAKFIKIIAKNINSYHENEQLPKGKEWIFCDEVLIE